MKLDEGANPNSFFLAIGYLILIIVRERSFIPKGGGGLEE